MCDKLSELSLWYTDYLKDTQIVQIKEDQDLSISWYDDDDMMQGWVRENF